MRLQVHEAFEVGLSEEKQRSEKHRMECIHYPIPDGCSGILDPETHPKHNAHLGFLHAPYVRIVERYNKLKRALDKSRISRKDYPEEKTGGINLRATRQGLI